MKKFIAAAVAFAVLTAPAFAQRSKSKDDEPMQMIEQQKKKDAADLDLQYQETMKKTGGNAAAPVKVDPWGNLRGTDPKASK